MKLKHARKALPIIALAPGLAARAAEGAGDECPLYMESAAFEAVTKQLDWAELHDAFRRFKGCDDGAIAEGYSDIVAILLARQWDSLAQLAPFVDKDPAFAAFVLRHIDATADPDDLGRIIANANARRCPGMPLGFCDSVGRHAKEALEDMRKWERQPK